MTTINVATKREIVLLHGGEGWANGDRVRISLNSAKGGGGTTKAESQTLSATYTINVEERRNNSGKRYNK